MSSNRNTKPHRGRPSPPTANHPSGSRIEGFTRSAQPRRRSRDLFDDFINSQEAQQILRATENFLSRAQVGGINAAQSPAISPGVLLMNLSQRIHQRPPVPSGKPGSTLGRWVQELQDAPWNPLKSNADTTTVSNRSPKFNSPAALQPKPTQKSLKRQNDEVNSTSQSCGKRTASIPPGPGSVAHSDYNSLKYPVPTTNPTTPLIPGTPVPSLHSFEIGPKPTPLSTHHSLPSVNSSQGRRLYQCDQCGECFQHEGGYNDHLAKHIHTQDLFRPPPSVNSSQASARYRCEKCGECFQFEWKYHDHLTKHTGEKPWKCEYCNVSLGRKRDLIKHGISKKHKAAVLAASQSTRNNARHSETENLPQEIQSSLSSKHGAAASRQSRFHRRKNSDLNSVQPPEIQGDTDIGHEHVSAVAPDLGLDYGQSEYGAHAHMQTQMGGYHPLGTPLIGSSSTTKPLAATVQQGLGVSFLSPPYLSIMPMNESLLSGLILPSEDRSYSQSQLGVYGVSLYSTSQLDSFGLNQPLVGLQRPIMPQTSNTTLINPSEVEFSQTVPPSFVVPSNYEYAYDQDDSIFDQFTNLQSPQYPSNSQTNVSDRESSVYGQPPPSNSGSQYPQQEHG